ncbi:MAG TPA: LamG-like jellyroll fold domain-containing protein [Candidatus Baltobacteraceae bacterium]|nr:LamG-like jellyroll fold domain-containing protein [Candidatus Baltobacteraceae bacterium]
MRQARAQSAIEYLMTYGWAILVIAVVLAVMFSLGLFNANTYGGRAHAGSCTIQRPYGPGTTQLISLAGVCNGQVPQFVAYFPGSVTSYIGGISDTDLPSSNSPVSMFGWVKTSNTVGFVAQYGTNSVTTSQNWLMESYSSFCVSNAGDDVCTGKSISDNTWHFVGFTYAGGTAVSAYVDGTQYPLTLGATPAVNTGAGSSMFIGYGCCSQPFAGQISNIQIYGTALSANDVKALYLEGIGGTPINLQSLLGWWSLNGDAVDYSGNANNGATNNVIWTSQWTNGYTQP